jgi:hypothetical protein
MVPLLIASYFAGRFIHRQVSSSIQGWAVFYVHPRGGVIHKIISIGHYERVPRMCGARCSLLLVPSSLSSSEPQCTVVVALWLPESGRLTVLHIYGRSIRHVYTTYVYISTNILLLVLQDLLLLLRCYTEYDLK